MGGGGRVRRSSSSSRVRGNEQPNAVVLRSRRARVLAHERENVAVRRPGDDIHGVDLQQAAYARAVNDARLAREGGGLGGRVSECRATAKKRRGRARQHNSHFRA